MTYQNDDGIDVNQARTVDTDQPTNTPANRTRRWPWITGIVAAFVLGVGIGAAGQPEPEIQTTREVVEVDSRDLQDQIAMLESQLATAESKLADQDELEARTAELDEREAALEDREAAVTEPAPEPEPAKEASGLTKAQEQAIGSAEDYLSFTAFSRKGLIDQLKFEGFSEKDATFAVDHIKVDWKEQAAKSAKAYLEFTHFSRSGLIGQLKFEGFTSEQAEYGADQAGL